MLLKTEDMRGALGHRGAVLALQTRGCGKLLQVKSFQNGALGLRQAAQDRGDAGQRRGRADVLSGRLPAAIARAVGEAVVLAAHGQGAAARASDVEVLAQAGFDGVGMVAATEALARECAVGAASVVVDGGAETWHGMAPQKEKAARVERPLSFFYSKFRISGWEN